MKEWINTTAQGLLCYELVEFLKSETKRAESEGDYLLAEKLKKRIEEVSPFITEESCKLAKIYAKRQSFTRAEPIA